MRTSLRVLRSILPAALGLYALGAQAQAVSNHNFVTDLGKDLHGVSVSAGGTGLFTKVLEASPSPYPYRTTSGVITNAQGQQQFTTWSAGALATLQYAPKAYAGIALNGQFSRYQERYSYTYASVPAVLNHVSVPTDFYEGTAAYLIHPRHMKFQPYMEIGGGYLMFSPYGGTTAATSATGTHQVRGTGLVETGFEIPTGNKHIAFRVSGRTLVYRAPNFQTPQLSTRSWRATSEPALSAVYRF